MNWNVFIRDSIVYVDENRLYGADPDYIPDLDFAQVAYTRWEVVLEAGDGSRWVQPAGELQRGTAPEGATPPKEARRLLFKLCRLIRAREVTLERVEDSAKWTRTNPRYLSAAYGAEIH